MFGTLIFVALQLSLITNSISDLQATPSYILAKTGRHETNPIIANFDPKTQSGLYALYGALTSMGINEAVNRYVPENWKIPTMIMINIIEIDAARSVKAKVQYPIYAEEW